MAARAAAPAALLVVQAALEHGEQVGVGLPRGRPRARSLDRAQGPRHRGGQGGAAARRGRPPQRGLGPRRGRVRGPHLHRVAVVRGPDADRLRSDPRVGRRARALHRGWSWARVVSRARHRSRRRQAQQRADPRRASAARRLRLGWPTARVRGHRRDPRVHAPRTRPRHLAAGGRRVRVCPHDHGRARALGLASRSSGSATPLDPRHPHPGLGRRARRATDDGRRARGARVRPPLPAPEPPPPRPRADRLGRDRVRGRRRRGHHHVARFGLPHARAHRSWPRRRDGPSRPLRVESLVGPSRALAGP